MTSLKRRTSIALSVASLMWASACGAGLSGSSTCSDFMKASAQDQQQAVNKLATQYGKPDYTTPLGAPEVPYYCSSNPDTTLDEFFQRAG